jgi:hypothetical protein
LGGERQAEDRPEFGTELGDVVVRETLVDLSSILAPIGARARRRHNGGLSPARLLLAKDEIDEFFFSAVGPVAFNPPVGNLRQCGLADLLVAAAMPAFRDSWTLRRTGFAHAASAH